MGTDKKRAPVIDEETAPVVKRIFEMYASGKSPRKIAETLNLEGVPSPATYAYEKFGQKAKPDAVGLWSAITIREMLDKIIYIGHMPQLRWTSLSYKNHKRFRKMKKSGLSFTIHMSPSFHQNFGIKFIKDESLSRREEKRK